MSSLANSIAGNLDAARRRQNMSLLDLAEKAGLPIGRLELLAQGKADYLCIQDLEKLSAALGVSAPDLTHEWTPPLKFHKLLRFNSLIPASADMPQRLFRAVRTEFYFAQASGDAFDLAVWGSAFDLLRRLYGASA